MNRQKLVLPQNSNVPFLCAVIALLSLLFLFINPYFMIPSAWYYNGLFRNPINIYAFSSMLTSMLALAGPILMAVIALTNLRRNTTLFIYPLICVLLADF